ncbi:LysM peptidoglycan-binding domain-containing protein [Dyella tabacisoli]|uniref:LysM peptidoglycan-binding domain-containing protein n=2 Tax=Dyella tabacisoli TaxID=2282381 RepID=A0A369URC0_9GAMM|nr:LysM peptidoglycan-binding domain-containing protein [Dyella tabacisoli]
MLANMNGLIRCFAATAIALTLTACSGVHRSVVVQPAGGHGSTVTPAPSAPGGSYQVARGDTLYSIAFRNSVDFRDLAHWNGIAAPYTIWPGQVLRLSPPGGSAGSTHAVAAAATPRPVTTAAPAASAHPSTPAKAAAPMFENTTETVASKPASTAVGAASTAATSPASAASSTTVVPVAGVSTLSPASLPPPVVPAVSAAVPAGATRASGGVSWRWPADGGLGKRFQSGDAIPGIEVYGKSGDPIRAAADGVVVYSGNGLVGYGELVIIKHNDSFLSAYGHNRKRLVKEGQRVSAGQQIAEMGSTGASRDELQFQIRKDGNPVDPLGYLPSR